MNFITGQNHREETTQNTTVTKVLRVQAILEEQLRKLLNQILQESVRVSV
jgi:hypothetical protein